MPKSPANLPKSLHTVTVLVRVATHLADIGQADSPSDAVEAALDLLGYSETPDTYALADAACRQLDKLAHPSFAAPERRA